jgi:hypothetical protein
MYGPGEYTGASSIGNDQLSSVKKLWIWIQEPEHW